MFENRGGVLFEVRAGGSLVKISTAFEIEAVVCDSTRLLWGYDAWSINVDDQIVKFRLEAGDFFGNSVVKVEQKLAFAGMHVWNPDALIKYLRQVPPMAPRVVNDLRISETDFNESASRRFMQAFEKARTAA